MSVHARAHGLQLCAFLLLLGGCAGTRSTTPAIIPAGVNGTIQGGQQPVSGASIQVYAFGTTGDGSTASPVFYAPVLSSATGNFTFPSSLNCPSPSSPVYLAASGGSPATGVTNPQLALMSLLTVPCASLPFAFVEVNEVTTVAAVYALAPYISSYPAVGAGSSDSSALTSAIALANAYASPATGTSPGTGIPSGYSVPTAQIYTVADLLATCVNSSGGVSGDTSPCGTFFALTKPSGGKTPTDSIAALLNLANNPALNTATLYNNIPPTAPFQPMDTVPPADLSISLVPIATVTLSPSPLSFATTNINFLEALPVTVTNLGATSINIAGFSITGANASDFLLDAQSSTCTSILAANSSCTQVVDFVPSAIGTRTALLQMANFSSSPSLTISLSGQAVAGSATGPITLTPSTLSFSDLGVPQTLTLTNAGNTTLNINRIVLAEAGYSSSSLPALTSDFVLFGNTCGTSLPAQSVCTLTLAETTGGPYGGNVSAVVTVVDDAAAGSQSASINYSQVSGCQYFQGQTVATYSNSCTVYLGYGGKNNAGTIPYTITGPNANDFITYGVNYGTCNPTTGGCNSSPFFFKPTGTGFRTATLTSGFGSITLTGWGEPGPFLNLLNYPSGVIGLATLAIGSSAVYGSVTIENASNSNLTMQTPVISGTDASEFSVSLAPNTGTCNVIGEGQTCVYYLTAKPTHIGIGRAALLFSDINHVAQQIIPLTVTGTPNAPAISSVTFPNTQPGSSSAPQYASITTYNSDPVTATLSVSRPGAAQFSTPSSCSQTPCQIGLIYTPPSFGSDTITLTVKDTVINLSTVSTIYATSSLVPQLTVSPTAYAFPTRSVGTTSIAQIFTLSTANAASVSLSGVTLGGNNAADFLLVNNCSSSIPGNSSCSLAISFAPKAAGIRTATVTIMSNAPSSPDTIQLTGTAQ